MKFADELWSCDLCAQYVCGIIERDGTPLRVLFRSGEPLAEGGIRLVPQRGTSGPSAGGPIREGRFSIARDGGPFAGEFRVEITATRETGEILNHPDEGPIPLTEQYLPARYNSKSKLTASVKAGEQNSFEFELTSHGDQ